ncbi:hypothetical protein C8A00DRAFT_34608 [Chaetomidium leptoderma]|uniref:Uncharacterized protein n=1 Tax=Chaetomidium leptoderma TaxID=669021 RepID=A0AAN6ZVR1_9PEZI|nr:hypothetical protein C8A00DRAFT_34608 [Chaetomidium leptoderma]
MSARPTGDSKAGASYASVRRAHSSPARPAQTRGIAPGNVKWTTSSQHALFCAEYDISRPPSKTDVGIDWINQSILAACTAADSKPAGHAWFWPHRHHRAHAQPLPEDPFFSHHPRSPGIKRRQHKALQNTGITAVLEEVHVSRDLPVVAAATRKYLQQGVSALCAALGLAWVVRVVLNHGAELDWLYEGFYPTSSSSASAAAPASSGSATKGDDAPSTPSEDFIVAVTGGDPDASSRDQVEQGSSSSSSIIIPAVLDVVYAADEKTGVVDKHQLLRSGDGVVFVDARGGKLQKEHVQALLGYVEEQGICEGTLGERVISATEFKQFWEEFRAKENISDKVPSPYNLTTPALKLEGDTFVVCADVFSQLIAGDNPRFEDAR